MNIPNKVIVGLAALLILSGCKEKQESTIVNSIPSFGALLTVEETASLLEKNNIVWVDTRSAESFKEGHIKGAVNINRDDLVDNSLPYSGMKASREHLASLLGEHGINSENHLIIYDDGAGASACRLWWILAHYGFNQSSILNGGLKAWGDAGQNLSHESAGRLQTEFAWADQEASYLWIDRERLLAHLNNANVILVDVRSPEEYSGEKQRPGNIRSGRIPGSSNINWVNALDAEDQVSILDGNRLNTVYGNLGDKDTDTVIVYCQSGVRSSHTTFVLSKILGYKHVLNYEGSWSEWNYHTDLPIEKDSFNLK